MNLSVKNMIFAFVAGLIVFSLIMTAICVGIFNSEIDVAKKQGDCQPVSTEVLSLDNAYVFKVLKSDSQEINFIALALIDNAAKKVILTPVYGDYLMPYKNALSYVSNVYLELGDEMIPEMVKAFSGVQISNGDIVNVKNAANYSEFKSMVLTELADKLGSVADLSTYSVEDFTIALTEQKGENIQTQIKQIDTEKSVSNFRILLGKN